MVKIENEQTSILDRDKEVNGKEHKMTFADVIIWILNYIPAESPTLKDQRQEFKIEDNLEKLKVGEEINLEDADYDLIMSRMGGKLPRTFPKHRDLLRLYDSLLISK